MVLLRHLPDGALLLQRPTDATVTLQRHPGEFELHAHQPASAFSWRKAEDNGREALLRAQMEDRGEKHAATALRERERETTAYAADVAAFLAVNAEAFAAFRKGRPR